MKIFYTNQTKTSGLISYNLFYVCTYELHFSQFTAIIILSNYCCLNIIQSAYTCTGVYYIHTKKYSPKSYVVNLRTQMSSSQSEERTMVFMREKNDTSNQNREQCFFTCEKNDTSNQKPQRCVSFAPKFPPFIAACRAASHTFYSKSFSR